MATPESDKPKVNAAEDVKLIVRPGQGWREAVMREITEMVDHSASESEAEKGDPDWRGVTR